MVSIFLFCSIYSKTVIRFGFCDIQNNQGLGKGYQPRPLAETPYWDLDYSGYHKNLIQWLFINSRGPEESDTLIKDSGFVYSDTYKWQKKVKK